MAERRSSYEFEDLLTCGRGELFGRGNAQLPLPPMLMFDRIGQISDTGGAHGMTSFATLLWDRNRAKRLQPLDLFTSGEAFDAAVRERFCSGIKRAKASKGIVAEATPNQESLARGVVDLDLLTENRATGAAPTFRDRRRRSDLYRTWPSHI